MGQCSSLSAASVHENGRHSDVMELDGVGDFGDELQPRSEGKKKSRSDSPTRKTAFGGSKQKGTKKDADLNQDARLSPPPSISITEDEMKQFAQKFLLGIAVVSGELIVPVPPRDANAVSNHLGLSSSARSNEWDVEDLDDDFSNTSTSGGGGGMWGGLPPINGATASDQNYTPANGELNFREFRFGSKIGESTYGEMFDGFYQNRNVTFLQLKYRTLMSNKDGRQLYRHFQEESSVFRTIKHDNVLETIGLCVRPPSNVILVTDFSKVGTLSYVLHVQKENLDHRQKLTIALGIAKAIRHLQVDYALCHRDLKPHNVIIDVDYTAKVAGGGFSRIAGKELSLSWMSVATSYRYMAPEVLMGQIATMKVDVFSFGVMLWELLAVQVPHRGMDAAEVGMKVVCDQLRPRIPPTTSEPVQTLINRCWATDPKSRPDFVEIVESLQKLRGLQ